MARLFLASASPRRAELLRQIGAPFTLLAAPDIDESPVPGEAAEPYVERMAREKAAAGVSRLPAGSGGALVLAADTCVVLDGRILGKPANSAEAFAMVSALSGREHRVLSAVCLDNGEQCWCAGSETRVRFRDLDAAMVRRYVDTGEGADKAGGYGIQGFGGLLVAQMTGSYSGVVGLPLAETGALLEAAGAVFWQSPDQER